MIKLNDVEIKLDKYPDGTFLFKDIPPIGGWHRDNIEWFFESVVYMFICQKMLKLPKLSAKDMVKKLFILSIVNRCTKMDTNFTYLKMDFG